MYRILVCDPLHEEALALLRRQPDVELIDIGEPGASPEALRRLLPECEAVIVRSRTRLREEDLVRAHRLRVVGRAGTGLDNIDVEAARRLDIQVLNAPGANANAVAELTMAFLLALARGLRFPPAVAGGRLRLRHRLRQGRPRKVQGLELAGKVLGLVGFGNIGRRVAHLARAFGMEVVACDPYIKRSQIPEALRGVPLLPFDRLLPRCRFVSLHVPLTEETRGLIGEEALGRMAEGAYLVNTARAEVVDEAAVCEALDRGRLAGYAADLYAPGSPLQGHERALLTPHIGASTDEAQARAGREIVSRVLAALRQGETSTSMRPPLQPESNEKAA